MNFVQKVWHLIEPFHKDLYKILIVTTLFETVRMGGPYIFGKILDLLIQSKGLITLESALIVIGGLAGVRIASLIIDHLTDWIIILTLIKLERFIGAAAYQRMVDLSLDYHEKVSTGRKISLINKGTDKLLDLIEAFTFEFQPVSIQLLVTSIMIFATNWKIGLIFSVSLIPFIFITFRIFKTTQKIREERHEAYELSSSEVGDTMTNISVVKGFAQEGRENTSFGALRQLIQDLSVNEFKRRNIRGFARNLLIEIFFILLLGVSLWEIKASALSIGSLVFLIYLIERAYTNIYRLGRIYQRVSEAKEPVDSLTSLMETKSSVKNADNPIVIENMKGRISFKNVTFAYKNKPVIKNVTFTIPEGSFTALVGKSGSGKSTIVKLLSRYYDPIKGTIVIDNKYNLKDLSLDDYRGQTAVVFQDSPVPNRTIWEVISYSAGKLNYSEVKDQVIEAAKLSHAHEFISELEEGYQTQVGERGVKLSGGQKQRIAIARALFAHPKILIMDEPTSHLDTVSEAMIQKALEDISKERSLTKIVIAHRLSTVQHADQILVMDKGKLVERGTHKELLLKDGVYSQIVKQSELRA